MGWTRVQAWKWTWQKRTKSVYVSYLGCLGRGGGGGHGSMGSKHMGRDGFAWAPIHVHGWAWGMGMGGVVCTYAAWLCGIGRVAAHSGQCPPGREESERES